MHGSNFINIPIPSAKVLQVMTNVESLQVKLHDLDYCHALFHHATANNNRPKVIMQVRIGQNVHPISEQCEWYLLDIVYRRSWELSRL